MTFAYDRYGNLLSKQNAPPQGGGSTTTFSVDSTTNRLVSYSTWPVTFTFNVGYDASGNMATRSEKAYDWDGAGRLMRVRRPSDGAQYGNHRYDAFGRRVRRAWDYPIGGGQQRSTGSIVYVYGAGGELLAEYRNVAAGPSGAEASTTYNIHMGGTMVAKRVAGTIYGQPYERTEWLHRNHLQEVVGKDYSNVSGCSDCSGWTWTYAQPFGSGGSDQFQGHKDDAETRLKYFGARYYDTGTSSPQEAGSLRWTSPDSVTTRLHDPQSLNKYAYVRNDPANLVDPDGRLMQAPDVIYTTWWFRWYWWDPEPAPYGSGIVDPADGAPRSGGGKPATVYTVTNFTTTGAQAQRAIDIGTLLVHALSADTQAAKECARALDILDSYGNVIMSAATLLNEKIANNQIGVGQISSTKSETRTDALIPAGYVVTGLPAGPLPSIVINTSGAAFKSVGSAVQGINPGTDRYLALVELHELGHLTSVLLDDGNSTATSVRNTGYVATACKNLLSVFQNQ